MTPLHDPHAGFGSVQSTSSAETQPPRLTATPQRGSQPPKAKPKHSQTRARSNAGLDSIAPELPSPEAGTLEDSPAEDFAAQGFGPVLQNQKFLRLWLGQVFSQVADKVYLVLMIVLITDRFQTAGQTISGWVSAIMIAFTIPAVLFGSVAGVFVDRWSKKWVLVLTNLVRGSLVLLLPPLLWFCQDQGAWMGVPLGFGVLLSVTFLVSTLTQFFAPAEQATIPLIVPQPHLLSANSLYTLTMMLAVIVGFAAGEPLLELAGVLIHTLGLGWDIGREWVVGGSYSLAGLILLGLATEEVSQSDSVPPPHIWTDIREGLDYLQQQPRVRVAMTQLVILSSAFAALAILVVRLAEVLPGIDAAQFGFLLAAGGVGMACSAGLLGQLGHRFPHYQLSGYGSLGLALMLGGLAFATHNLWMSVALLVGVGVFAAWIGVPMQTTIQEETPEDMRGKVFGLQNNAVNIALSLPLVLAGLAETKFGLEQVFVGLAVLVVTGGLLSWYIARTS